MGGEGDYVTFYTMHLNPNGDSLACKSLTSYKLSNGSPPCHAGPTLGLLHNSAHKQPVYHTVETHDNYPRKDRK